MQPIQPLPKVYLQTQLQLPANRSNQLDQKVEESNFFSLPQTKKFCYKFSMLGYPLVLPCLVFIGVIMMTLQFLRVADLTLNMLYGISINYTNCLYWDAQPLSVYYNVKWLRLMLIIDRIILLSHHLWSWLKLCSENKGEDIRIFFKLFSISFSKRC
jgi:hypothetical protein